MLDSLVWLFPAHREAQARIAFLEQQLEIAHRALVEGQSAQNVAQWMTEYAEKVLTEQPFPDGKVPENAWLTPASDPRDG